MKPKFIKNLIIIFVILLIIFVPVWIVINSLDFSSPKKKVKFGVTFSHQYADEILGMDWTEVYWNIITDLGVKNIRIVAPWDMIEQNNNEYNFNDLDWMIQEAKKRDINIILAIGRRTPRWPECHDPKWIKDLPKEKQNEKLFIMLEKVVRYFKKYDNIIVWQVENEPFLKAFGECPKPDKRLIKQEVQLVKSLDSRPILMTDSGELSNWKNSASLSDIFGTTMYRMVWNKFIGNWRYPLPPVYYYLKAKRISKKYNLKKIIVSELQAEPWASNNKKIIDLNLNQQFNSFDLNDFKNNLKYVKRAGFTEAYLWGVEWWYWLKVAKNRPEFWQEAQKIWQNN